MSLIDIIIIFIVSFAVNDIYVNHIYIKKIHIIHNKTKNLLLLPDKIIKSFASIEKLKNFVFYRITCIVTFNVIIIASLSIILFYWNHFNFLQILIFLFIIPAGLAIIELFFIQFKKISLV